ncbi:MAG: helix-turn-helix domain-containing protein [Planctomycetota bacterium]
MNKLLTLKEVAEYLKVHINTVRRLIEKKQLPGLKVGWQWRVREGDLETFVKKRLLYVHDWGAPQLYFRLDVLDEYRREAGKYFIHEAGFHGRLGNKVDQFYAHHDRSVIGSVEAVAGKAWTKEHFGKDDFKKWLEATDGFAGLNFYKMQLKSGQWALVVDPREFYRLPETERKKWPKYQIISPEF